MNVPVVDVLVVGGGVAGLACAWRLQRAGRQVLLLERDEPGGNVQTEEVEGFLVERGPHSLMASGDHVFTLGEEAGIGDQLVCTRPEAEARFIARDGRLHAMPSGAWSFLTTPLLSWRSKLALASEPLRIKRGRPDDSAATFFERRFGPEAARVLAGAFISGVYAGDPAKLSAAAAFRLFWSFEQARGSMVLGSMGYYKKRAAERRAAGIPDRKGLFSYAGGLGRFSTALAAGLGERCLAQHPVTSLTREQGHWQVVAGGRTFQARAVVLATPPQDAAALVADRDAELAYLLRGIPMAPVAVAHLGFRQRQAAIPEGFGFLVPRGENIRTLGVLFPSRLFGDRAPNGGDLLAGFVGGMLDQDALALADDDIRDIVLTDLRRLTGLDTPPDLVLVRRYPAAIPQLVHGHLERMEHVQVRLDGQPGLYLAGNYPLGVGLKDAVLNGQQVAGVCDTWLGTSPTAEGHSA